MKRWKHLSLVSAMVGSVALALVASAGTDRSAAAQLGAQAPRTDTPALQDRTPPRPRPGAHLAPGAITLRLRAGASSASLDALNGWHGAHVKKRSGAAGLYQVQLPAGVDVAQALADYRSDPAVAEANYTYVATIDYLPNDTNYGHQWNMQDTVGGVHAQSAWDIATNRGQGVVVAVIDSGVAYENFTGPGPINPSTVYKKAPDLAAKTFVAPWDFVNNDAHPNDDNGHGTHVTGTIAQDTNNAFGVAGVAYNATIMPVKVIGYDGTGQDADLVSAIYYAVDHGAKIISMSLGFTGTGTPDGSGVYCTEIVGLNAALDYAYAHNVTVVAASGNDGGIVTCPAAYPSVIAVGATGFDGQVTSYSNFGAPLDVSAPGGDPNVDLNGDGYTDGVLQETYCYDSTTLLFLQTYSKFCDVFEAGTSMATPHVAGTAALLLGENPSLTPDQVGSLLQTTARDRGPAGWDPSYGWGAIDAYAAVAALQGLPSPTATATGGATNTPGATSTPTATRTPTRTPTNTRTPTVTNTPGPPTSTFTPSNTPTITPTFTPSNTPTITPTFTPSNTPTITPTPLPLSAQSISAGGAHTCALTSAGGVRCWGANGSGQLGDGTLTNRPAPVDVPGLSSGVVAVSGGGGHTCALTAAGGVMCWGRNDYGQLGDGTTTNRPSPTNVIGLSSGVAAISAGGYHTCAVMTNGTLKCWGRNNRGQLGNGTSANASTPFTVPGLTGIVAVAAGGSDSDGGHTCALTSAGAAKCWGRNDFGQIGDGTTSDRFQPVDVSGLSSGAVAIGEGRYHSCALTNAGGVKCWGWGIGGQLGLGTGGSSTTPVDVVGINGNAVALTVGGSQNCALMANTGVKCWGYNSSGQLGDGTTGTNRNAPVDVLNAIGGSPFTGALAVSTGGSTSIDAQTCALVAQGIKCWGLNSSGQVGDGTTTLRPTPVDVVGFQGATPTPTSTSSPTASATSTATSTPPPTNTSTPVPTSTSTSTSTPVPSSTSTSTPTSTATAVPTSTPTQTPTNTSTPVPTSTNTPTATNTATQTNTPTAVPTSTPTNTATPLPPTSTNTADATAAHVDQHVNAGAAHVDEHADLGAADVDQHLDAGAAHIDEHADARCRLRSTNTSTPVPPTATSTPSNTATAVPPTSTSDVHVHEHRDANADLHLDGGAADVHVHPVADEYRDADTDVHEHAHTDCHTHEHGRPDEHPDRDVNEHADAHADQHVHAGAHLDEHAGADQHAFRDEHGHRDADADDLWAEFLRGRHERQR